MAVSSQVLKLRSAYLYLEENKKTKLIKNSPLPCIPKSTVHSSGTRPFRVGCLVTPLQNLKPNMLLVTFHFRAWLTKRDHN